MTSVALVTCNMAASLDEDMPLLVEAFESLGVRVATPAWDDPAVDWSAFDAALLRSTWDYMDRLEAFMAWIDACAARTRLFNPPALVRRNLDKHYLQGLEAAGVPIVPTRFAEPGDDPMGCLGPFIDGLEGVEFVVKPAIGAGSRDAARFHVEDRAAALAHLAGLLQAGRSALLQPYLTRVDVAGETAMVHIDGVFSHAIRKGPLLTRGGAGVAGLFAPETISVREPAADELALAGAACRHLAALEPLYLRVDLIRGEDGSPVVLELEMTEPSLFFPYGPGSAARLASALLRRIGA
ncbi:MAG: ATP-grasp domain-containing protein [Steroidobacteraceae bacterium]